jgi:hypothetical protein
VGDGGTLSVVATHDNMISVKESAFSEGFMHRNDELERNGLKGVWDFGRKIMDN